MKTMDLFKKAYSYAEISLVVAIIGILAGTAAGITALHLSSQSELDTAKINLANKAIADVYSENMTNVSHANVMAMLTTKEGFINGFSQYFETKPGETEVEVTNFIGENEEVAAITLQNGVNIGFEYIRDNCSNNNGAPCGTLHVVTGAGEDIQTSDFFVYEDHLTNQMPYDPKYQTYNAVTNSFDCDLAKAPSYLASLNNPKLYFDGSDDCFGECNDDLGIKVADTTTYDHCVCPPRKPANLTIPEFGYYDPSAEDCISCYGNKVYSNGACTCGTLKDECNGVFDDEYCECTSCEYNLVANDLKTDCVCPVPNTNGWTLKEEYRFTNSKANKICDGTTCEFCVEKCADNKVHSTTDYTKCVCVENPDESKLVFENNHQFYDVSADNCISTCPVEYKVRNRNNIKECICPDQKPRCNDPEDPQCFDKYFTNDQQIFSSVGEDCIVECPTGGFIPDLLNHEITRPNVTRDDCVCNDTLAPRVFDSSIPKNELKNKTKFELCICPPKEQLEALDYFKNGEEYDPNAEKCKTAACPVVFKFNGQDVHGVRTNGVCGCPAEREFLQGGKYYGYINPDTEVYDKDAEGCKIVDTRCNAPKKASNHNCICMTETEINAWNPSYIGEEEEYYDDNGDKCKRNKCSVRFEFGGQKVRGIRNEADQSCNCPAEREFLQGGKYYGYINPDTEVYDNTQQSCKRTDTSCEAPTKAFNHDCICMTEAEINAWNPRYLNPLAWEYYDDGGIECRREVCRILFEYNGEQVRYRNPNTQVCECPPESQFLQGGKYYGYINTDTEVYDFSQPNCKRVTTSCEGPTKAVNHNCVCMTEAEINAWNPSYIGDEEEYYDDNGDKCKRNKCSVRFEFGGQKVRGIRNEADQSCNCPAESEFKAGGKYAGYIDFESEKYDSSEQSCKSSDCKGWKVPGDTEGCICNPETPDASEFANINIHKYYDPHSTSGDCLSQCAVEYKVRDSVDMTACVCPDTKPTCTNTADPYCFDRLLNRNQIFDKTVEENCINTCVTGSGCVGEGDSRVCFSDRYPITNPNVQKTECVCAGTLYPRTLNKNYTLDELRNKDNLEICVCPGAAELKAKDPDYINEDYEAYDPTSINCKRTVVTCDEDFQVARNKQCVCKDEADIKPGYINPETEEYYPQDTQTCKRTKCEIIAYFGEDLTPIRGERDADGECGCPSQQKFEQGGVYYGYINEDYEEYDSSDPSCKKVAVSCENYQVPKLKQCICKAEADIPAGYIGEDEEYYAGNTQTCKRKKCAVRFTFNGEDVRGVRNESDQSCNCPAESEFQEGGKYFGYLERYEVYAKDELSCKIKQCPSYGNMFVVMNFENTNEEGVTLEFNIKSFATDTTLNAITYYGSIHNANAENDAAWQALLSKMSTADKNRTFEKYSAYLIAETGKVIGVFTPDSAAAILDSDNTEAVNCNKVCKINGAVDSECAKTCESVKVTQSILKTSYSNSYYYNANDIEEYHGGKIMLDEECEYNVKETIYRKVSPLVLDLKGDGLEFTSLFNGVKFDLNADGKTELTAWTTTQTEFDNAFLVYDKNANGQVDNGSELFGDQNGADNGFNELAKYDDNNDGIIDELDGIYNELKVWVDFNKNGKVDYQNNKTKELKSLKDADITEISTAFTVNTDENGNVITDNNGNVTGIAGFFKMLIDGVKEVIRSIIDVFFVNA